MAKFQTKNLTYPLVPLDTKPIELVLSVVVVVLEPFTDYYTPHKIVMEKVLADPKVLQHP